MSSPDGFVRALARAKTLVAEAQFAREDGDYEVAVDSLQEAVDGLDQTGWLTDVQNGQPLTELHKEIARALANCLGMIGGNYRRLNRLDDAVRFFEQGRKYEEDEQFGVNSSYSLINAITLPIEMGRKSAIDQADLLRNAVRALIHQTGGERRLDRWAWADLGECYLLLRDLPHAQEAYESFRKHGTGDSLDSVLPVLIRIRDALNAKDPDTALVIANGIDSLQRAFERD